MAQRNLNVLIEVAIQKEKPVVKKNTPLVKKTDITKGKHVVVTEGSPPFKIRSVKLMK
jgi:hypothetical protein